MGYVVHGIIRRASTFNTSRIQHLYEDARTHQEGRMHLHYGDLTDSSCLVKIISQVRKELIIHIDDNFTSPFPILGKTYRDLQFSGSITRKGIVRFERIYSRS